MAKVYEYDKSELSLHNAHGHLFGQFHFDWNSHTFVTGFRSYPSCYFLHD